MDGQEVIVLNTLITDGGKICENNHFGEEMQIAGTLALLQLVPKYEKHLNMVLLQYFLLVPILIEDMVTLR
ncbi:hypothetical protein KA405_01845 [Patescibacteria group bacterium]|nr:hypothetical protein [Patescibacteria group bacterium]